MREHPERFILMSDFSWSKGGFGTVMIAHFSLKNSLPWAVKDIRLQCKSSAPSGTELDRAGQVVYERIEAGKTKKVTGMNMGLVHSQAARAGCTVESVIVIR